MGVDLFHILKHSPIDIRNSKECEDYCLKAIRDLKNYFCEKEVATEDGWNSNLVLLKEDECESPEFYFRIHGYELTLYSDFWLLDTMQKDNRIIFHEGDFWWVRREVFAIARALGIDNAWHTTEHYTWNGEGPTNNPGCTLAQWLAFAQEHLGKEIPEVDSLLNHTQEESWKLYEPVFHDNFVDCKKIFKNIQGQLPEYRLICISDRDWKRECLAELGGEVYRINPFDLSVIGKKKFEPPLCHGSYDVKSRKEEHWFANHEWVNWVSLYGVLPYQRMEKLSAAILNHNIRLVDISNLSVSFPDTGTDGWETRLEKEFYQKEQMLQNPSILEKMILNREHSKCFSLSEGRVMSENGKVLITQKVEKFLTIPNGVEIIGVGAFAGLDGIEEVAIPNTVKRIEAMAFLDCGDLVNIRIPDSVISIGESVFAGCTNVESVVLSNNLQEIPEEAFLFVAVDSIEIPNSVKRIGFGAFRAGPFKVDIIIPEGVEEIDGEAFSSNIKSIKLPSSLKKISPYFYYEDCIDTPTEWVPYVEVHPDNPVYYSKNGTLYFREDDILAMDACYDNNENKNR